MSATTLYRLYSGEHVLLYVGIAGNPGRRWEQHAGDKGWWPSVAVVTVEHYPTRDAALAAERLAIINERPAHNVLHAARVERPPRCAVKRSARERPALDGDALLTIDETCERLRIEPAMFWRLVDKGELRALGAGQSVLVRESDLLAFIDALPAVPTRAERRRATEGASADGAA